ncbi:hypothetical protein [Aquimarina longa]|uniref:hypothetical protein n=1 Tax=Aquimarina longa TaxID=1080221 RepID=UPI00130D4D73|nr:hypothetical protein [Aquimarina longa]
MRQVLYILLLCTISCQQVQTQESSDSNYVTSIVPKIKHYDKEPMYFLRLTQSSCVFEVLVNSITHLKKHIKLINYDRYNFTRKKPIHLFVNILNKF